MRNYQALLWICCIALALLTTGCYQYGPGGIQPTDSSQAQPTFTLPPSDTPVVISEQEIVVVTATPDPDALATSDAQLTAFAAQVAPEAVAGTEEADSTGFNDPSSGVSFAQDAAVVPEQQQVIDEGQQTATQIILEATQTIAAQWTQTAIAIFGATYTPTPSPTTAFAQTTGGLGINTGGTTSGSVQPPVQIAPGADCIHEVRAGETLFRISMAYGVRVADIAARSSVSNFNLISIGQRLTIPGCGTTGARPLPTSTPGTQISTTTTTTGGISTGQCWTTPGAITTCGTGTSTGVGTGTTTGNINWTTVGGQSYTIQQGDTLYGIAQQFGVDMNAVAAANGIVNVNSINMGDTLTIPVMTTSAGTTTGSTTFGTTTTGTTTGTTTFGTTTGFTDPGTTTGGSTTLGTTTGFTDPGTTTSTGTTTGDTSTGTLPGG
jgi:LysM repeat protein